MESMNTDVRVLRVKRLDCVNSGSSVYFQQPRPIAAFIQVEIGLSQILLQIYFWNNCFLLLF